MTHLDLRKHLDKEVLDRVVDAEGHEEEEGKHGVKQRGLNHK